MWQRLQIVMNKAVTYYLRHILSKIIFSPMMLKQLTVMLWLRIDYQNTDVGGEFSNLAVERSILDYKQVNMYLA